ncbi:MAG: Na-translocating system protein MpsC family protein [Ilumatobacter fluminis]|uniref:Na-translocating system protein MpsC family protein n=1 Tax=Ilumatobacter fluminis TaxID=467091 RepID=UPI0032EB2792
MSVGELKQEILRLYNAVNQDMWGIGVRQQRVDVFSDRILIVAEHQRVPVLEILDAEHRDLTRAVDAALIDENKRRLGELLESTLGLGIRAILKDYDPETQLSATVVMLREGIGERTQVERTSSRQPQSATRRSTN